MRATRIEMQNERDRIPLVVRARFERTFFGLGLFAAATLFLCGGYLLTEAMRYPLESSEVAVLIAGFALAFASFVITYLAWPRGGLALARHEHADRGPERWKDSVLTTYGKTVQDRLEEKRMLGERQHLPGPM
jgi:hypothetical protein